MDEPKVEILFSTEEQWERWAYSLAAEIESLGVVPVYRPSEPALEKPKDGPQSSS